MILGNYRFFNSQRCTYNDKLSFDTHNNCHSIKNQCIQNKYVSFCGINRVLCGTLVAIAHINEYEWLIDVQFTSKSMVSHSRTSTFRFSINVQAQIFAL